MKGLDKDKEQLVDEIEQLRHRVAELEASEAERNKTEGQYRMLIDNAAEAITVLQDGSIKLANPKLTEITGYTIEELTSVPFVDRVHPDDRDMVIDYRDRRLKGDNVPQTYSLRIIDKAGNIKWLERKVNLVNWEGKPAALILDTDITERKRVEEELQVSEARYRAVLENANEVIVVVQDNMSKYSNPKAAELTGYSQKELTSRPFIDFVHPDDHQIAVENYSMRMKGDWSTPGKPVRILGKDGSVRWMEFSDSEITWEGRPAILFLVSDVTEYKNTEEALRQSESRYRELAESITDIFFAMDEKLRYTYWNKASENITGIPAKEALGKRITDIFPDDEATGKAVNMYRAALATKDPQYFTNNFSIGDTNFVFDISVYPTSDGVAVHAKDITGRVKLEDALAESEQWYRYLFDNAPFGIGFSSLDGKVINMNKAMQTITGYLSEEIANINLADTYVHKADREQLLRKIRQQGGVVDYPVQLRRKDGTVYDALLSSRLINIGDKEFVQTIYHDITDRKRAEDALRESEERYRTLVELSPEAIFVASEGKHVFVNSAGMELYGASSPDQIIGKPIIGFIHPDYRELVAKRIQEAMESGMTLPAVEEKFIRLDGTEIDVEARATPLIFQGKPAIQAVIRNISERKRAEEALRESEERFRTFFEDAPTYCYIVSPEGKIMDVNRLALAVLGYSEEELVGKPIIDTIYEPGSRQKTRRLFEKWQETGKLENEELKITTKEGTERTVLLSAAAVRDTDGKILYSVSMQRDITERKQAEESLILSEQNFRDSIERSPLGVRIVSEGGKTLYANRALLAIYGYTSLEELASIPTKQRYTTASYAEHRKRVEKRKRGEHVPPNYEISIVRKDGQIRHLAVSRGEVVWNGEKQFQVLYQDVTERKQAEQEYQTIIQTAMDGFWLADMQGQLLDVNEAYCDLIGYSRDELLNMSIPDVEAVEKPEETAEHIRKIGEFGLDRFETRHRRKDGELVDVEVSVNYVPFHGGRMFVAIRDISERKRAEEALKESEGRYRLIAENISDVIWTSDMNLKMTYMSPSCIHLHGYPPEEAINLPLEKGVTKESYEEVKTIFTEALADEAAGRTTPDRTRAFEAEFIRKDGSTVWAETAVTFIRDKAGKAVGIQGVTRNIDERKRAEEALRTSEERYRLLAENMRDVILALDMDLRFIYVSPSVKSLGDRAAEEVMSESLEKLLTPSSLKLALDVFAEELALADAMKPDPTRSRTLEVEVIRSDGSILWAELKMSFLRDQDGQPIGVLGVMRDITERKLIEEERRALEQKAQLASHLASVGELSAGIAHEVNNPLTGVIGYAELLLQEDVPKHIRSDIEIIHEGARRVADVVKGLLTFARQTKPERTVLDINQVIQIVLRLRAYELETANIKVITKLAPDLPITIADAGQLQQVFLNLIINAETEMRSAHNKGKLTIRTEHIDNTIRVSFKDDGPGIAKENLKRIFDPFFTTRETGKGTGLGLSICHGIVTEHGGRIYVESELGKGATFIVELPVITEKERPKRAKPTRKRKKVAGAKILVVDDEPVVRRLLSQVLTEEGHVVEATGDAKDVLNRIKNDSYSLILLDMRLPGMSGSELYERIKEIESSLAKRVVFITGDVMGTETE
ncbi:MAG: PAS domain S-box protein, partial [Chloroflexota bacterium]